MPVKGYHIKTTDANDRFLRLGFIVLQNFVSLFTESSKLNPSAVSGTKSLLSGANADLDPENNVTSSPENNGTVSVPADTMFELASQLKDLVFK